MFEGVLKASHMNNPEVKSGNYQTLETLLKSSPPTEVGVWLLRCVFRWISFTAV